MGVVEVLSLGVAAASAVSQDRQRRRAARAQTEANNVNTATGEINNTVSRRRAAREARIRIARLRANAQNTGTEVSSGLSGASSAIGSNLGIVLSQQKTAEQAARGLSAANQTIASASNNIARIREITKLAQQGIKIADDAELI